MGHRFRQDRSLIIGPPSGMIVRSLLRATGSAVVALMVIYYLLPLDHSSTSTWAAVTMLVIGLVVSIGLVAFQVRSIVRPRSHRADGTNGPGHAANQ